MTKIIFMYRLLLFIMFLSGADTVKSQILSIEDSSQILKSVTELNPGKVKFVVKKKCIPKDIRRIIKKNKNDFKITDDEKKYRTDLIIGRKKINRLLKYMVEADEFFILTYNFGGFVSNTRFFYITKVDGKVDKIFNFLIPEHNSINSLIQIFKTPNFDLKKLESYYW